MTTPFEVEMDKQRAAGLDESDVVLLALAAMSPEEQARVLRAAGMSEEQAREMLGLLEEVSVTPKATQTLTDLARAVAEEVRSPPPDPLKNMRGPRPPRVADKRRP